MDFPAGQVSFADEVHNFTPGPYGAADPWNDPLTALGIPDYIDTDSQPETAVSVGHGGTIELRFANNSLITSGNENPDLWIFEVGPAVERTDVYVSADALNWISVGTVEGATSGIDIDAYVGSGIVPGTLYSYVRLIDDAADTTQDGVWAGADIDAVGAISSGTALLDATVTNVACRAKDSKVDVTWDALDGALSYRVLRHVSGGSVLAGEVDLTVLADFGLTNGVTYTYTVRGVLASGEELADSAPCSATPAARSRDRNRPPVINSTPRFTATQSQLYTYDVEATDPEGEPLSYSLAIAPQGVSIDAATGLIQWIPDNAAVGIQLLTVVVQDPAGKTASQSWQLSVADINEPPSITSTPVTAARAEALYSYDVEASDPEGDTLTFTLDTAPAGMSIDSLTGLIEWTPGNAEVGDHPVTVRVEDLSGLTDTQSYTLTVVDSDTPVITSVPPTEVMVCDLYAYDVEAMSPTGDTLVYSLDTAPAGMTIDPSTGLIGWSPGRGAVGDVEVVVRVTDGVGLFDTQSFNLSVLPPSSNFYDLACDWSDQANPNGPWSYNDGPNSPISVHWDVWAPNSSHIQPAWSLTQWPNRGHVPVWYKAVQGGITPDVGIDTPVGIVGMHGTSGISSLVDTPAGVSWTSPINGTIEVSGGIWHARKSSGRTMAWTLYVNDLPVTGGDLTPGDPYNSNNPFDLTVGYGGPSVLRRSVVAGDLINLEIIKTSTWADFVGLNLRITEVSTGDNRPPVVISTPPLSATEGQLYSYDVEATDPDVGDVLTFSLDVAPVGMSIDPASGLIQWTPTAAQVGDNAVTVRVEDTSAAFATQSFTVSVVGVPTNNPPSITSTPAVSATEGQLYSYDVEATDPDVGDVLTFSLDVAPAGMSIDPVSGLMQWTPTNGQVGDNAVTVRVTDTSAAFATQSFTVNVAVAPNNPPSITSTPVLSATEGQLYSYDVEATDPDAGDVLTFSLDVAPAGLSIDPATGLIQWTPAAAQVGDNAVTVRADDNNGAFATQSFTVNVAAAPNDPPTITSTPVFNATANQAYQYDVEATDPNGDTITYSLTAAPTGMSIDVASGLVQWTPTADQVDDHAVTVRASDDQAFAEQTYTVTVADVGAFLDVFVNSDPAVIDIGGSTTITVSTQGGTGAISTSLTVGGALVTLDASGQAVVTGTVIGGVELIAAATDSQETVQTQGFFSVRDPSDTTPPLTMINAPVTDSEIAAPVDIIGTANDDNLVSYKLVISPAGKNQFTELVTRTTPVINGVLGQLDPTQLANGLYDVAVIATDAGGLQSSKQVTYSVTGDLKVGNFSFTVQDLSIPLSGIPITVNRTYDTRRKSDRLDFGYGWSVDYQDVKIEENRVLGTAWQQTSSGGLFPTWCIEPIGEHYVAITLPDGRTEEFDFSVSPQCQQLIPLEFVAPAFTARPGTHSTLVAPSSLDLWYTAGELLDLAVIQPYDPNQYTLTTAEGYVYSLDQDFGVSGIRDPNGNVVVYSNTGIIHSSGRSVSFTRDAQGRITEITDPSGNSITYTYDVNGNLASVTDRESYTTEYRYNRSHGLTDYIDPRGITPARNIYDVDGRLTAHIDAEGNRIEYTHNIAGRQEVVSDRKGNITVYTYDDDGNVLSQTDAMGNTTIFTYDTQGNLLTETDPLGNTITRTYDASDNLLTETDARGHVTTNTYNARNQVLTSTDRLGNTTANIYDSQGNLLTVTDPLGGVTTNTYSSSGNLLSTTDALANATTFEYDASGNRIRETDPLGNVTTFTFDVNGNELTATTSRTDAGGTVVSVVSSKTYDADGRITRETDALGHVSTTEYNAIGKVAATTDKNGNRTVFEYDTRGNLTNTRYPDGTAEGASYDAAGNKIGTTDRAGRITQFEYDALNRLVGTVYPDGGSIQSSYDAAGRVIAITDENGNQTRYQYDASGNRTRVTDALGGITASTYDANGNQSSVTDANGNTTTFEYDALGRKTRTVFSDATETTTAYDPLGRVVGETDQAGLTTQFDYDALGRLTKVTDAAGGETRYAYDELGNKINQTDANGHTTRWAYDSSGRNLSRTLPEGMAESFGYDANGNKTSHTDFNGDTTGFAYDANNRLLRKDYPDGTAVILSYTPIGQRETVTDSRGVTQHTYDSRDRLVLVENPGASSISYTYDAAGNRTSVAVPSGTTTYAYDALKQLASVTDPIGALTTYSYDPVGNRASTVYPNGTVARYTYDALNHLIGLENLRSDASVISSYDYTLGPAASRIRVVENGGRSVDYFYDSLYRLTREAITDTVNGNSTVDYTYDAVGNRLTKTDDGAATTNYTYDANDRLLSAGTTTYTYDANGNTLTKIDAGTTSYSYDFENRLIGATTPSDNISYLYDPDGIRKGSTFNGVETRYLVDKNRDFAQVLEEANDTGSLSVNYIYGDDLISQYRSGGASYYHYDGLGSTRILTNSSESISDSYVYGAFGELTDATGITGNNYLFTGDRYDPNINLYYLRARFYNQELGRFMTSDIFPPDLLETQTLNRYAYVNNNPINFTDPTGLYTLAELQVSLIINLNIRTTYNQNLFDFFLNATNIAFCSLEPALELKAYALRSLMTNYPVAERLLYLANEQISQAYFAISQEGVNVYSNTAMSLIPKIKIEIGGLIGDTKELHEKINKVLDWSADAYNAASTILKTKRNNQEQDACKIWSDITPLLRHLTPLIK